MDGVRGDVLGPPHGTTPAAVIANKIKLRSFKSSEYINEKGEVELQAQGIPTNHVQAFILLVVPDTAYNKNVPILIGTKARISLECDNWRLVRE